MKMGIERVLRENWPSTYPGPTFLLAPQDSMARATGQFAFEACREGQRGGCVLALGKSPAEFFQLVWRGGFGTSFSFQNTLQRSAPLILTGLAFAIPAQIGLTMCIARFVCKAEADNFAALKDQPQADGAEAARRFGVVEACVEKFGRDMAASGAAEA